MPDRQAEHARWRTRMLVLLGLTVTAFAVVAFAMWFAENYWAFAGFASAAVVAATVGYAAVAGEYESRLFVDLLEDLKTVWPGPFPVPYRGPRERRRWLP